MDNEIYSMDAEIEEEEEEEEESIIADGAIDDRAAADTKSTASAIRRKIEDHLEKRSFLKELNEDLMDANNVEWSVSD